MLPHSKFLDLMLAYSLFGGLVSELERALHQGGPQGAKLKAAVIADILAGIKERGRDAFPE